jgi:hypothetical protein
MIPTAPIPPTTNPSVDVFREYCTGAKIYGIFYHRTSPTVSRCLIVIIAIVQQQQYHSATTTTTKTNAATTAG